MLHREWLTCQDPRKMIGLINWSSRRMRLLMVACCRRMTELFYHDAQWNAIEVAERYADVEILSDEVHIAWNNAHLARMSNGSRDTVSSWLAATIAMDVVSDQMFFTSFDWMVEEINKLPAFPLQPPMIADMIRDIFTYPVPHIKLGSLLGLSSEGYLVPVNDESVAFGVAMSEPDETGFVRTIPFRQTKTAMEVSAMTLPHLASRGPINTPLIANLVRAAYEERLPTGFLDPDRLAVLSDALEENGCQDGELLNHLREGGKVHCRGCWAIDSLREEVLRTSG